MAAISVPSVAARAQEPFPTGSVDETVGSSIPAPPPAERSTSSPDDVRFELAAKGGYTTPPVAGGVSSFGGGGGGRLGFVLKHVYAGAAVTGYVGGSDDAGTSDHAVLYGAELGYEVLFGDGWILRPQFGVGGVALFHTPPPSKTTPQQRPDVVSNASGSSGGSSGPPTQIVSALYVEPALVMLFAFPGGSFVGGHAGALFLPNVTYGDTSTEKWLSYSFMAELGHRF